MFFKTSAVLCKVLRTVSQSQRRRAAFWNYLIHHSRSNPVLFVPLHPHTVVLVLCEISQVEEMLFLDDGSVAAYDGTLAGTSGSKSGCSLLLLFTNCSCL